MIVLKGIPASSGIAIGEAFVLSVESPTIMTDRIQPEHVAQETARLGTAMDMASTEIRAAMELSESEAVRSIVETHVMIIEDPSFSDSLHKRIESGYTAEAAVVQECDALMQVMYQAKDSILRDRAQDFETVKERLLGALRNRTLSHAAAEDRIVVAGLITPQDMLFFKQTHTLGFITEIGGINSHACIVARGMGIPAVIGIRNATGLIREDVNLIVDGYAGDVIVDPDDETLAIYREKQQRAVEYRQQLGTLIATPAVTTDGVTVRLKGNIDTPDQVDDALMSGCDGIGLVRTEFLLMQRGTYPTEDEQVAWYTDIAKRAYPLPVTFRAFDIGSDKFREGIPHHEDNPALGLRGIRFLMYRPDLFLTQVRAILRASRLRNVRFMIPMVSVLEELYHARAVVADAARTLRAQGEEFDASMPFGIMIETPAAALMADSFVPHVDFLSIGTNDLAQYTLATDRTNELVADIFDAMHPSVLRMIHMVVTAAHARGVEVSVCGELAGHSAATEVLIGLGIHELSVAPSLILELKNRIRHLHNGACMQSASRMAGGVS